MVAGQRSVGKGSNGKRLFQCEFVDDRELLFQGYSSTITFEAVEIVRLARYELNLDEEAR